MSLYWLVAFALAQEAPPAEVLASPAPPPPTVHLVATGGTGGVGSGSYDVSLPGVFVEAMDVLGGTVTGVLAHHGALSRDDSALIAEDRRAATLATFLEADALACGPPEPAVVALDRNAVVLATPDSAGALVDALGGSRAVRRRCTAGDAVGWLLSGAASPVPDTLAGFEFRLGFTVVADVAGVPVEAELLFRPDREAARRVGAVRARLAADPSALFVDAGSFVDGVSSVQDGALSLHRYTGFATLRALAPTALAPGRTELAAGPAGLVDEAEGLPYTAANWVTDDPALALPASITAEVDGLTVAFVGFVDPAALARPSDVVTLVPPAPAIQAEVDRLRASDAPPAVIVVLGEAGTRLLQTLQRELHDVDVLIGDTGPRVDGVRSLSWDVREPWAPDPPPSATLPLDGVLDAVITVGPDRVERIDVEPVRVNVTLTPDPEVLRLVNAVRARRYPPLDRPLLPAPAEPTSHIEPATWTKVVCEAVLEAADADVALLPDLPPVTPIPGPLTELMVVDRLAVLDELVVHTVPGDRLPRVLDKAFAVVPVHCGAPLGEQYPKARGRALEAERSYRVVTTDRAMADPTIAGMLDEGHSPWVLDQRRAVRPVLNDRDRPVTLRAATLDLLRQLRDDGQDPVATLAARSSTDLPPQWLFRVRRLSLAVERFQGAEDDRYAAFPETLATSPSSTTIDTTVDVALDYSSQQLYWDLRAVSMYSQLTTADDQQEPADDLRLSTSGSLPGASFPVGALAFMPYGELLLDSELTAVENEDGTVNPLQRDASITLGLSSKRASVLRVLRVGAFALRDLTVTDKPTEWGGRADAEVRFTLGPGLYWTTLADAFLWADTPTVDDSDLRFKALVDTRLQLALAQWLNTAVYAESFSFAGRAPRTAKVGHALTVGATLDVVGAFDL